MYCISYFSETWINKHKFADIQILILIFKYFKKKKKKKRKNIKTLERNHVECKRHYRDSIAVQ